MKPRTPQGRLAKDILGDGRARGPTLDKQIGTDSIDKQTGMEKISEDSEED